MQTKATYDIFTYAWTYGLPIDNNIANLAAWGLPVPEELALTEEEIQAARPSMGWMPIEQQMAQLALNPMQ